jgi:hypothetical protein
MNIAARQAAALLVALAIVCTSFAPLLTPTASADNSEDVQAEVVVEVATYTGAISGIVFNDLNENNQYDSGEPLLKDWKVKLHMGDAPNGYDNDVLASDYTDNGGNYFFGSLQEGIYFVEEVEQDGWTQTTSDSKVTLTKNNSNKTVNFANVADEDTGGNNGGGTGGETPAVYVPGVGGLIVKKVVVGGFATPDMFSFSFNGTASTTFNTTGENVYTAMATGTYTLTETATSTYTVSYSNCAGVLVVANATSTCTITNAYIVPVVTPPASTGNGSGNGGGSDTTAAPTTSGGNGGGGGGYVASGPLSIGFTNTGSGSTGGGLVLGASTDEPSCSVPLITTYMREHQANKKTEVTKLQNFLNKEMGSSLPVTGFFGPLTTKAVNDFQYKYKVEILEPWIAFGLEDHIPTGYVYKTTRHKINQIACANLEEPAPLLP